MAVGSGDLLYACDYLGPSSQHLVIENIATGDQHLILAELPIVNELDMGNAQLDEVGTQWLSGTANGYRSQDRIYLNWHTGQLVTDRSEPAPAAEELESLDDTGLLEPLCQPLKRIATPQIFNVSQTRFTQFAYAPPFAVTEIARDPSEANPPAPLRLMRCGATRSDRLPGPGVSVQLANGILTWIAPGKNNSAAMYATRLYRHRTAWHGPPRLLLGPRISAGPNAQAWLLQHTATTIYQSIRVSEGKPDLIYGARMPGAPHTA